MIEAQEIPNFGPSLAECLQTAVERAARISGGPPHGASGPRGNQSGESRLRPADRRRRSPFRLPAVQPTRPRRCRLGFIKLEWAFFEGGKRIAERHVADSKVREAMAQAESIADTIAFQVNEGYRRLVTARLGIERARPAVKQAQENYRLVRARAAAGDATPVEITDAETALTRAEQNFLNSTYDYLSAIAKLDYAIGRTRLKPTLLFRLAPRNRP